MRLMQAALQCVVPLRRSASSAAPLARLARRAGAAPCCAAALRTSCAAATLPRDTSAEESGVTLRPYQAENVAAILSALSLTPPGREGVASFRAADAAGACGAASFTPSPKLLYVLPTGGGKTVVLAAVLDAFVARGQRCLFLVHRVELVEQTVRALGKRGLGCGVIAADYKPRPLEAIQVASVATLARRADEEHGQFDLIVIDEAHHAVANTYEAALARWPQAAVLGATATPFRLDGLGLSPPFHSLLAGPKVQELIDDGHLVRLNVLSDAASVDTRGLRMSGSDFAQPDLARRAGQITGDVVKEYRKSGGKRRAIVYGVDVEHCKELTQSFRKAGIRAEMVTGTTPAAERHAIFESVRSGATQVLVNVEIATEGLDVPEVEAVLMVRPTLSRCLYLQMVGRGLRAAPGKTDCLVLDHAGNVALHGLPTDDFPLSLAGAPRPQRREADAERDDDGDEAELAEEGAAAADGPARRRARFGDAAAELQPLRMCALVRADTGEEVVPAAMTRRRGLRFDADTYEVHIAAPGKTTTQVSCRGRSAFLKPPAWGKEWCGALADLLAVPRRDAVWSHVSSLVFTVSTKGWNPEWAAQRALSQWGAEALLPLLEDEQKSADKKDDTHKGPFNPLRASRAGGMVRSRLRQLVGLAPMPPRARSGPVRCPPMGADGKPPPPPQPKPCETVTLVVQDREA